ncbi:MAG: hypothetical protein GX128_06180 [Bacteroidales bacterium]|nr:hypothetical protein [Bacteroidales bacterium]
MKKTILTFLFAFTVLIGIQARDLQLDKDGTTLPSTSTLITPGDANCDGVVNILDVITISNYILGFSPEPFCFNNADLNNDGVINLSDLIATVNIIVGGGGFTCGISTVTDVDGNEYNTVLIGDQCWMAENLNTGVRINASTAQTDNGIIEKYCYNNSEGNCDTYGGLYQWNEVMQYSTTPGVQGICPTGWHVPSDSEWSKLVDYVVSQGYPNNWDDPNGASNALKSCRQVNSPLGGDCATTEHPRWNEFDPHHGFDVFGFSALPGGGYIGSNLFLLIGELGDWLSSTEDTPTNVWGRAMYIGDGSVSRSNLGKTSGYSVRCVKDTETTFPKPSNLMGTVQEQDVTLIWQAPELTKTDNFNLVNYNVYRDNEKIGETTTDVLTYLDSNIEVGTYVYGVSAVYGEPLVGESEMITVSVEVIEIPFTCGISTVTDVDGNEYNTVLIGDQCWMAENLKYLPDVVGPGTGSNTIPYNYVYGYNGTDVNIAKATSNYTTYGVLYNWSSAMNACPTGWHLPNDTEWTELTDYLGGENIAGGKLKETGTGHWSSPNTGATNETGFTALPGGHRSLNGEFSYVEDFGYYWSATESSTTHAWYRDLSYYSTNVYRSNVNKDYGFSVRCVKD